MISRKLWMLAVAAATLLVSLGVIGGGTAFASTASTASTGTCAYPVDSSNPAGSVLISSSRTVFDQTSHDILAMTTLSVGTTRALAIAGNFTSVSTPDGVGHAASNLAILDEATGRVIYAAKGVNGYVRAVSVANGSLYVGGDFTSIGGVSRSHIAALTVGTWALRPWQPGAGGKVRAIAANSTAVYYGDEVGKLHAVRATDGTTIWTDPVSGGAVKALLLSPDQTHLYVGGLFEQVSTLVRHGLVELTAATGAPILAFAPGLAADSGVGADGQYDGEENLSLAYDISGNKLLAGDGGHGATVNRDIMRVLDPVTGVGVKRGTEGDVQAVAVVTKSGETPEYVQGRHRNHLDNLTNCPYNYFGDAFARANVALLPWDPKLGGGQDNLDGGNGGIQAMAYDAITHRLFLGGAFTNYGGSCDPKAGCVGGTPLKSLAEYLVS